MLTLGKSAQIIHFDTAFIVLVVLVFSIAFERPAVARSVGRLADLSLAPWIDSGTLEATSFLGSCPVGNDERDLHIRRWRADAQIVEMKTSCTAGDRTADDVWVLLLAPPWARPTAQ